jgi:hypothetical protein
MAVSDSVDPGVWFAEQIGACEPDLLRQMVSRPRAALPTASGASRSAHSARTHGCPVALPPCHISPQFGALEPSVHAHGSVP